MKCDVVDKRQDTQLANILRVGQLCLTQFFFGSVNMRTIMSAGSQPYLQVSLCLNVGRQRGAETSRQLLRHSCFTGQYKHPPTGVRAF